MNHTSRRVAFQGIVLVAFSANTCPAPVNTIRVNNNTVTENNIGSASGFTAFDGIFVGVVSGGTIPGQADSNVITEIMSDPT
jgi:hypothetical protein